MHMFRKATMSTAVIVLLNGCASFDYAETEFGCKGMPDGVTCAGVRQIYELTDGDDYQAQIEARRQLPTKSGEKVGDAQTAASRAGQPVEPKRQPEIRRVVPRPASEVVPLRTPAQVMRIYVRPWESKDGDLHVPGYVYTEIVPRRWQIGDKAVTPSKNTILLSDKESGAQDSEVPRGGQPPRAQGNRRSIADSLQFNQRKNH